MLIAGNWKMFKGPSETRAFAEAFEPPEGVDVVLCPPFPSLATAVDAGLAAYAQNVHWAREGAFTGEASAPMLNELGVQGAIVGHSERRRLFAETDETVARRTIAALEHGLGVIACVGESGEEREAGQTELILRVQVEAIRDAVGPHERLVIAYEPVWAIGTGLTPTVGDVAEVHGFLRRRLAERLGAEGEAMRILYGGSVKPDNARALMAVGDVNGALVGGASLKANDFIAIIAACSA
jgi:triosephosphate isomerase